MRARLIGSALGTTRPAANKTPGGTVAVMPDPEPSPTDDPLAGLRKLAGLAKELGISDVSSFTDALEAARNDGRGAEVFKPLKNLVEQFATSGGDTRSLSELGARLRSMVAGRESVTELQHKVEVALLHRIEELSTTAPAEAVMQLATAYARIRAAQSDPPPTA